MHFLSGTESELIRSIGPREISVNRTSAVRIIHGPQSKCVKGPWYSKISDNPNKINLLALRDHEIHRGRRRAWDRGLGTKGCIKPNSSLTSVKKLILFVALSSYQPQIQKKVNILIRQLKDRQDKDVEITQWTQYYSFDVMGEITFKKDFRQLEEGTEHYAITAMHAQLEQIGLLGSIPWLMHLLVRIPGLAGPHAIFDKYCVKQVEQRKAVRHTDRKFYEIYLADRYLTGMAPGYREKTN